MEHTLLNDPLLYPEDKVLASFLGEIFQTYDILVKTLTSPEYGCSLGWNYYKDGHAWLCKVTAQKKTVCWISVWKQCFKIGFYFTERNTPYILDLDIEPCIKDRYLKSKPVGKLIPLSIEVYDASPVKDILQLVTLKMKFK
jgi:hypothetical protein